MRSVAGIEARFVTAPTHPTRLRSGGVFFVWLLLSGCATLDTDRLPQATADLPRNVELTAVPFFPQEAYQCGPAALATTLNWSGVPIAPETLTAQVYLPARQGSLQVELLGAARRAGRIPYVLHPRLEHVLRELAAGRPVLALQNLAFAWYPKWHYAVAVGYDLDRGEIVLRSGVTERHALALATFERTWRRGESWAMVTLVPGEMPMTAEELTYLESVVAFERLGDHANAARAYRAATTRWPASLTAWLGLGNSLYADGDKAGAEKAFREGVTRHPEAAVAYNNLAQTLADMHRLAEAEAMAQRAVELGGTWRPEYEKTLADIRRRKSVPEPM